MNTIRPCQASDTVAIGTLILGVQREEFGIPITLADQPDLADLAGFYQQGRGNFWVAERDGEIVGTIGLRDIGGPCAALRKMFVAPAWRGREHGVAAALLATLIGWARAQGLAEVFLGTTDKFLAAHRFYAKHGFVEIDAAALPPAFPRMAVDTKFFVHRVAAP